jgi:hypothetical protein
VYDEKVCNHKDDEDISNDRTVSHPDLLTMRVSYNINHQLKDDEIEVF